MLVCSNVAIGVSNRFTFINVTSFASKPRGTMTNKAAFITTSRLTIPIVLTRHTWALKHLANHFIPKCVFEISVNLFSIDWAMQYSNY